MKSAKLLGFIVSNKGIEVDPNKVKAIQVISAPETEKQSTRFPRETKLHNPFYFSINNHLWINLLVTSKTFYNIKYYLQNSPFLVPPVLERPFIYI